VPERPVTRLQQEISGSTGTECASSFIDAIDTSVRRRAGISGAYSAMDYI
jgi:hypothetical protein